jgi:Prenyltransferase and squalene oxidase repeat
MKTSVAFFLALAASPVWPAALRSANAQAMLPEGARAPAHLTTDTAIRRALEHLKATQKQNGAWAGGFGEATSITSLAVMAYLSAGHVPCAPGPYRDAVERGVHYVLEQQHTDGMLVSNFRGGPMYCHGISTLMLAEVVGMIPDAALADRVQKALSRAVDVIVKAQDVKKGPDHSGGWRYAPNSNDSDISVTGWQVMALRAAKSAGFAVDSTRIDSAIRYLKRCALKDGGFAYQPGQGPNNARTGVGILALEICGTHLTPEAMAGSKYLLMHPPRWGNEFFFYEAYYCSQAMFQIGEEAFQGYQQKLVSILFEHQQQDGSWLSSDSTDQAVGRNYCTAMCVLALAVDYGYLPIYQR